MKVFKVVSKYVAFDEDESMVISAKTPERALTIANDNWIFRGRKNIERIEFSANEIDLKEEQIISVAHYGD